MQFAWRVAVGVAVFAVVGMITAKAVIAHEVATGAPAYAVRMGGWTAGLFVGGVVSVLVFGALMVKWRR